MVLQAQPIPVVDFTKYEIHGMVWPDNYWCYRPRVNNIIINNKISKDLLLPANYKYIGMLEDRSCTGLFENREKRCTTHSLG